jgi:CheY-like chemotaxis protein
MTRNTQELQILLVEDNPADAEMTMDALRGSGLINTVEWVKDGAQALDFLFGTDSTPAAEYRRLRLVLLDLRLPRVSGIDVLRALRGDPRTRALPVVVLTSSQEESDIVRAYDLGANGYLVKPVASEEFLKSVGELGLYWMLLNRLPGETA